MVQRSSDAGAAIPHKQVSCLGTSMGTPLKPSMPAALRSTPSPLPRGKRKQIGCLSIAAAVATCKTQCARGQFSADSLQRFAVQPAFV